jgi:tryptophanyl-tRNA synthetase
MFPGLMGSDKMSSSQPGSTIFTTDPSKVVRKKIANAFTGGAVSIAEQKKLGGRPEVCSVFKYQYYLFEPDDNAINALQDRCRNGEIMCGECKKVLADSVVAFLEEHQKRREEARKHLDEFMMRDH